MPRDRRLSSLLALLLGLGLSLAVAACDEEDSDIGKPCESIRDCSGDHICDIHNGLGTCQVPHEDRILDDSDALPLEVDGIDDQSEASPTDLPDP